MADFIFGVTTGIFLTVLSVGLWNHFNNDYYVYLMFYIIPLVIYALWRLLK